MSDAMGYAGQPMKGLSEAEKKTSSVVASINNIKETTNMLENLMHQLRSIEGSLTGTVPTSAKAEEEKLPISRLNEDLEATAKKVFEIAITCSESTENIRKALFD